MKICIISSRFYPQLVGSGTSAYVMARELQSRGHDVTVLTDAALRNEPAHRELAFDVKYIESLEDWAMGRSGFREPVADLYAQLGSMQPNVIHVCNFMPLLLVAMIRTNINCPVVFSFFNTPVIGSRVTGYFSDAILDTNLGSFIIKSDAYDRLILGSQHYVEAALALGALPEKIQLSYLAPDVTSFKGSRDSQSSARDTISKYFPGRTLERYVLLPSRITAQKGIIEAIEALAIVNRTLNVPCKLLLTGMAKPFDEAYAQSVWDTIHKYELDEYILVPNRTIYRTDLAVFFKAAELVLVPSWYEGLGLAAIEAQYLGVPLAASDTTGLNEVVTHKENGLLFTPRDSASIAECIMDIMTKEVNVDLLVKNALESVKIFSLDRHVDELEACYHELIERTVKI